MKLLKEIISWTGHIMAAFAIATLINIFIFQPTQVKGSSMESTLHNKDYVFVNKLPHTLNQEPDYGDIVIIDSRINRPRSIKDDLTDNIKHNIITTYLTGKTDDIYWIKRVIGKSGDTLEFKDGKVIRNGSVLDEQYIKEPMNYSSDKKIKVPENHVFVMGDNRNNSCDSRYIGSVPLSHIVGKYAFRLR